MRHPSIRIRLLLGTAVTVAIVLLAVNFAIYRAFDRMLSTEIDTQLLQSASLLGKSAELEAASLDYEWQEAMKSTGTPEITGLFQFFDVKTGLITKSPELGDGELPVFHGRLNEPVLRDIRQKNGRHLRAVGLLHHPFTDQEAIQEAAKAGKILRPEDFPQVLVCARETESLSGRLHDLRVLLIWATAGTLAAIWGSIVAISAWTLRPIKAFSGGLLERSEKENPPPVEIPRKLPLELLDLAGAFNTALDKVEKSREREKEFALHAAHELRTPVAGILTTLEQAVRRPRSAEDLGQRISEAITITSGMRSTLDSLMQLARLRGSLEHTASAAFDPQAVIRSIIASAAGTAAERSVLIRAEMPDTAGLMENDPGLFRSVVSNLVENAVRHAPEGSAVELSSGHEGGAFLFSTSNPCGDLREKDLGRLFEPFQRGEGSADDEGGHAGLGLSLVKESVRVMGGTIHAAITGGLIIFSVRLPL